MQQCLNCEISFIHNIFLYLVNSGLLKSPKLTNDHLKVGNQREAFIWGHQMM
jgi:hypothetical protein